MSDEDKSVVSDEESERVSEFFKDLSKQMDEEKRQSKEASEDSDEESLERDEYGERDNEFKEYEPPRLHYELRDLRIVLENLMLQHDFLRKEADAFILKKTADFKKTLSNPYPMVQHKNPLIRIRAAQLGLLPEILKYDPVAEVRFETLKQTGHYSEFYQTREDSIRVVKEMIRQGIDPDFYISLGGVFKEMVETQEGVDRLIDKVIDGDVKTYRALVSDFNTVLEGEIIESKREWSIKAIEMLTIHYEEGRVEQ